MTALENALPDVLNAAVGELNFKNVIGKLGDIMVRLYHIYALLFTICVPFIYHVYNHVLQYKFPFSLPPYYIAIIRCLG